MSDNKFILETVHAVIGHLRSPQDAPQAVAGGAPDQIGTLAVEQRPNSPDGATDMELVLDWNLFEMFRDEEGETADRGMGVLTAPVGGRQEYLLETPQRPVPAQVHVEVNNEARAAPPQRFQFQAPTHPYQMDNWDDLRERLREILTSRGRWPAHIDCESDWWMDCLHYLAYQVVFECFRDHELEFTKKNFVPIGSLRNFLQWWLQESVGAIVQEIITRSRKGETVNAQFLGGLNDRLLGIGLRTIHQLYEGTNAPSQGLERVSERNLAIHYLLNLARVTPAQSRHNLVLGALRDLSSITDEQFVDIFKQKHKQLDILPQADITAIMHIRGDLYITALQFADLDAFHNRMTVPGFEQAHTKYGRLPGFDTCPYPESRHLWKNYNMMVITKQIVPAGKKRFMEIASRLVQKRSHQTGGGNCGEAHRREVLFEIIAGKCS
jgi:hypothetical protein